MDTDLERARADALMFLKHHNVGVLATVGGEHHVQATMVYYTSDSDFNIYLMTFVNSRKFRALQEHPQVAFTVSTADVPQTLQIEGMAMDISLDEEAAKKKDELFTILNSNPWFYPPPSKLEPAESVVVWLRPTWVRWADYAFAPTGHVFQEIQVKK